jgi:hypothetical protein
MGTHVDMSGFLDPKLNKMIVESIHNDVMESMAAKGKIVYHMTPDELGSLFKTIAFNVKEKVAQHQFPRWRSAISKSLQPCLGKCGDLIIVISVVRGQCRRSEIKRRVRM